MRRELAEELRAGRSRVFADNDDDQTIFLRRFIQRHRKQCLRGVPVRIDLAAGPEIGGQLFEKGLRRTHPVLCCQRGRNTDLQERREQACALLRGERFQPHTLPLEGMALGGKAPVEDDDLPQEGRRYSDRQLLQQCEMRDCKLTRLRRITGEAGGGELIGCHRRGLTPAPQWERPSRMAFRSRDACRWWAPGQWAEWRDRR